MRANFSTALTSLVIFLGCAVVTYYLLGFTGRGSPTAPNGPTVVGQRHQDTVKDFNPVQSIAPGSLQGGSRDTNAGGGGGGNQAENDVEVVRRLSAEMEFEFMVLTRPKTLTPEAFNGDLSAMSRFVTRLLSDPEAARASREIENLHAEFFESEDLRRKRVILDRLKSIRDDTLGALDKKIKAESLPHRASSPSSVEIPSAPPVKTYQ